MIDEIIILKLESNKLSSKLKEQLKKNFPNIEPKIFQVKGVLTGKNDGYLTQSFFSILCHNTYDNVALDITKNHLKMIESVKDKKNVLFLEEDSIFNDNFEIYWKNICNYYKYKIDYDIFYLGYCNWPILLSFFITKNIIKPYSPLLAHAYILSNSGIQKVLNYAEKNSSIHIDKMFTKIPNFNKFASNPILTYQNKNPALMTKALDYLNISISNTNFLNSFHYISIIMSFIITFIFIYIIFNILKILL